MDLLLKKLYFHNPVENARVLPDNASILSNSVSKCLEQFFPNGRILPYNIPVFLQNIITIKYISNNGDAVVDIDVDIPKLGDAIHNKAMEYLNEKQFKDASKTFRAQGILQPNNPNAFYNVACAESLMGNTDEALVYLNKAIDLGYRNLNHMLLDSDFNNINSTEGFRVACSRLQTILSPSEPETKCESPAQPEPKPQPPSEPKCEPEPQPSEPTPAVIVPPFVLTPWAAELEVLHDIGYLNDEIIVPILEKNRGNVELTVLELLEM